MGWGLLVLPLYLRAFQVPEGRGRGLDSWAPCCPKSPPSAVAFPSASSGYQARPSLHLNVNKLHHAAKRSMERESQFVSGSHFDMEKAGEGVGVESVVVGQCGTDVISDEMIRSLFLPLLV